MVESPASKADFEYIGDELELFQWADNWKRYVSARVRPYVSGDLLEVGAGLGANVSYLHRDDLERYLSLEPDSRLCEKYLDRQRKGLIPARCELVQGTLETLPLEDSFNSILYIDVIEHIEDDRAELERAFGRLRSGGHLVVLCPAHNWLYSPFDKAIGHFRRYNKRMYREVFDRPPLKMEYLDSVGMLASSANKLILKQSYPSEKQFKVWDRLFVRLSNLVDPLTFRIVGKSILGVWKK